MSLRSIKTLLVILALLLTLAAGTYWLLPIWRERQLIRQAEPIQASLESYRQQYGQYPDSLKQIGIVVWEDGPIYYQRRSDTSYILWFGRELGESTVFDSTTRAWR